MDKAKSIVAKGELLFVSICLFFHNVFKSRLLERRQIASVCGRLRKPVFLLCCRSPLEPVVIARSSLELLEKMTLKRS